MCLLSTTYDRRSASSSPEPQALNSIYTLQATSTAAAANPLNPKEALISKKPLPSGFLQGFSKSKGLEPGVDAQVAGSGILTRGFEGLGFRVPDS